MQPCIFSTLHQVMNTFERIFYRTALYYHQRLRCQFKTCVAIYNSIEKDEHK